jgi:SAM-dependent methyltransferase
MVKINLGCGSQILEGWANVDYSLGATMAKIPFFNRLNRKLGLFSTNWDKRIILHDLRKPFPWADASADVVYSSHTLEHFTRPDGLTFLKECFRVLKPGGLIRIVVPDLAANVQHYLNGKTRADYFLEGMEILYSTDRTPNPSRLKKLLAPLLEYPHKCYYDASALIEIMDKIGFDAENMKPFESRLPEIRDIEIEGRTQYAIMIEGIKIPEARPIGNSFERELIPLSSMALPNDAESLPGEAVGEPVENKATPVEHT